MKNDRFVIWVKACRDTDDALKGFKKAMKSKDMDKVHAAARAHTSALKAEKKALEAYAKEEK